MAEFKREERYMVIKLSKLSNEEGERGMTRKEQIYRLAHFGKALVECVVIESDWPEYEQVWRMIEARVTGQPSELEQLRAEAQALREERDAAQTYLAGGEQEVRKIVTESLLGMISSVASASPPPGAPLPDFIQAPIDRAATRIGQHIARVLAERDTPAANAGQVTDDQLRQAYLAGWLASAQGWNGEHPPMACTTADWLRKAEESVRKIAAAPDLGGDA